MIDDLSTEEKINHQVFNFQKHIILIDDAMQILYNVSFLCYIDFNNIEGKCLKWHRKM